MSDKYPTDEELKRIEKWDFEDFHSLMEFAKSIWWCSDWGWSEPSEGKYYVSTGGWSGNECIIEALQRNSMFWRICWVSSRRGGHYEFEVQKLNNRNK